MRSLSSVDEVFALLESGGGAAYFGEPVTVLEHSLQAASFVERKGGGPPLIAAALLHDVGHLLHQEGENVADQGLDTRHEDLAVTALGQHLPTSVLDPIQFHVAAKRFLCSTEPRYRAQLSPASLQSLNLQGGPMSVAEVEDFRALPCAQESLLLRRADDAAKVKGLVVPQLNDYRALIESLWR